MTSSTAVRVLGWTGVGLALAAVLISRVLGPVMSDPDHRELEQLIVVPLGLGVLAVLALAAAVGVAVLGALWRWWRRFAYPPVGPDATPDA